MRAQGPGWVKRTLVPSATVSSSKVTVAPFHSARSRWCPGWPGRPRGAIRRRTSRTRTESRTDNDSLVANSIDRLARAGFDAAMTSFVAHTTVDCHDAYALSEWWKDVLGYVDIDGDPNLPGHEECPIVDPESGHRILFIEVPDEVLPEKRMHFDLRPRAGSADDEVTRLLGLGATRVADRRGIYGPGTGWVVLADPEANLFCVLQ